MHYKNRRPAQNGDTVVNLSNYQPSVGVLYDAVAGNDFCNGRLAQRSPSDPVANLAECLHIDDVRNARPFGEADVLPAVPQAIKPDAAPTPLPDPLDPATAP